MSHQFDTGDGVVRTWDDLSDYDCFVLLRMESFPVGLGEGFRFATSVSEPDLFTEFRAFVRDRKADGWDQYARTYPELAVKWAE